MTVLAWLAILTGTTLEISGLGSCSGLCGLQGDKCENSESGAVVSMYWSMGHKACFVSTLSRRKARIHVSRRLLHCQLDKCSSGWKTVCPLTACNDLGVAFPIARLLKMPS